MEEEINILKHELVPKHLKLTQQERTEILQKYNISITQLPKIKIDDPTIKDLKAEIGDIIKIIRPSPTAKETTFYRAVTYG